MRGCVLKVLSFFNWILLALGATTALLEAVTCLIMLPYPELAKDAGADFAQLIEIVLVAAGFTLIAALATWLLEKRHRAWPVGQALLGAAVVTVILFTLHLH